MVKEFVYLKKISIFYILSFLVFIFSILFFIKNVDNVKHDFNDVTEVKVEVLKNKNCIPIINHKGGKQLSHNDVKITVNNVISKFNNLKSFDKDNLSALIIETMIVETLVGKSKYDYASKNYRNYGIVQLREDTVEWMLSKLERKDIDTYAEIMSFYNYDKSLRENLLTNVQFGIASCVQYYYLRNKNLNENIKTTAARSNQWKKNYNTSKGLGTEKIYQDRVNDYYTKYIIY